MFEYERDALLNFEAIFEIPRMSIILILVIVETAIEADRDFS